VGIALRFAQVLSSLIILPVLTRSLGIEQFGVWGVATSLVWIAGMLDLGVGSALVTLLPVSLLSRGRSDPRDIVGAAVAFTLGLCLLALVCSLAAVSILAGKMAPAFAVAGVAIAVNIPLSLSGRLWLALQKGYVANLWELAQTCVTTLLLVLGAWSSWPVWGLVACVYGVMVAVNGASLAHALLRHPELRPVRSPSPGVRQEVFAQSRGMLGASVAGTAGWAFDNALAFLLLGPAAAAWMNIALRLCTTAFGFINVIALSFWPAFAEAAHTNHGWVRRSLVRGGAIVTGLALAGSLVLAALGGPPLRWWLGRSIGVDSAMLWIVGAWVTTAAAFQVPFVFLLAVSRQRAPVVAMTVAALGGLALKILLADRFGAAGILAANPAFNLLVVFPVCLWAAWSWLRVAPK